MNSSWSANPSPSPSRDVAVSEQPVRAFGLARILHLVAATVALSAASYLTIQKWQGKITDLAGCGGSEGCSQLLGGRWANWLLVPVSFWAMTVYLPLLVLGLVGLKSTARAKLAWIGAGILTAGAIWFIGLQLFVEHRFCIWCFTMHTCSLVLLTCIAIQTRSLLAAYPTLLRTGLAAGISAAGLLIGGQLLGPQPKSHELTSTLADAEVVEEVVEAEGGDAPEMIAVDAEQNQIATPISSSSNEPPKALQSAAPGSSSAGGKKRIANNSPSADSATSPSIEPSSGEVFKASSDATNDRARDAGNGFDALPEFDDEPTTAVESKPSAIAPGKNEAPVSSSASVVVSLPREIAKPAVDPIASSRAEASVPPGASELPRDAATSPSTSTGDRVVDFLNGELRLTLSEVPLIGDPQARTVVVKFFDYTCKSCRTMHDDLTAIQEQFPGQLAIVMLPCPLDRDCNPYAPPGNAHRDACQYARLGLAVWRADSTKFGSFHDEMFHRQGRTTVAQARELAVSLVGEEPLAKALEDPWVKANLRRTFALYQRMAAQNPRMPKIVLKSSVIMHGLASSRDELTQVLQAQAGLGK